MKDPRTDRGAWTRFVEWLDAYGDVTAVLILVLALLLYAVRLGGWWMYDDEGGYLYAAWRISLGEMPYRDFLTPQMPLFLYIGGVAVSLVGPSALALRVLTMLAMLAAGWVAYLLARDTAGKLVALLALCVFLAHRNVYYMARFYRPEAYMVLFDVLGLYLGVLAVRREQGVLYWVAGAVFALSTLCKLFGLLPFAGYVAFLFYRAGGLRRLWAGVRALIGPLAAFGAVLIAVGLPLYLMVPDLAAFVIGHHVRQGAGVSAWQTLLKGGRFLGRYALLWPGYTFVAAAGTLALWQRQRRWAGLYLAQLPALAAFLLISRTLNDRLLIFLAPCGSVLAASGIVGAVGWLSRGVRVERRVFQVGVGVALAALALFPHLRRDVAIARWDDDDTFRVADQLRDWIWPDEVMVCDYPGLNFFAQRETTYLGAGLSGGAVGGGQVRGLDLARELESQPYRGRRWVVVDVGPETGHTMTGLLDYEWFLGYLARAGFEPVADLERGDQRLRVYQAPAQPAVREIERPWHAKLGDDIHLLGYALSEHSLVPGDELALTLYWQVDAPIKDDYKVFVHLVDGAGELVAQSDARPRAGYLPTYLWTPGSILFDRHRLALPADLPPGVYRLGIGMYSWPEGPRLPAWGKDGTPLPGDWIALPDPVAVRKR